MPKGVSEDDLRDVVSRCTSWRAGYDLLVDMGAMDIRRVQVKTGTTRPDGSWRYSLERSEYHGGRHRRAYDSSEELDYFGGCVDGDGQLYPGPAPGVEGLSYQPAEVGSVLSPGDRMTQPGFVICVDAATGELLRDLIIDPRRDYQPTGRPPGPTRK